MHDFFSPVSEFIPSGHPEAVTASDSVLDAARLMRDSNIGCVFVEEAGRLAGIFTERDFLIRVAGESVDPAATTVGEVMTANPESLKPIDEIAWAIHLMAVGGFRNVPVVDDEKRPVGIVSSHDVIDFLSELFEGAMHDDDEVDDWHEIGGG